MFPRQDIDGFFYIIFLALSAVLPFRNETSRDIP